MQERNEEILTKDAFVDLWQQYEDKGFEHDKDDLSENPRKIFEEYLDMEDKGFLTKHDILNISRENLKAIARLIDPPHGPVTEEEGSVSLDDKQAAREEL